MMGERQSDRKASRSTIWPGTFQEHTHSGRHYKLYVPTTYNPATPAPMMVMIHGCKQNPDDFARGTQMNRYAEDCGMIVVYPGQAWTAHPRRCWNWFKPDNQIRRTPSQRPNEPARILRIVQEVKRTHHIDSERVYAVGISSGACMAVILAIVYSDVFAAIGATGGLGYATAKDGFEAMHVMKHGVKDPIALGDRAYHAMYSYRHVVPLIAFHGTDDRTVDLINTDQLMIQWAYLNRRISNNTAPIVPGHVPTQTVSGMVPGGRTYSEERYTDCSGTMIMKRYLVHGMGHAWSGGSLAGSYTDPTGPNASKMMAEFLLQHHLPPKQLHWERHFARIRE